VRSWRTRSSSPIARLRVVALGAIAVIGAIAVMGGCAGSASGPYSPQAAEERDPMRAQRLTLEATDIAASNPAKAEKLLREALTADLYHGPAHNNLGVLYLKQSPAKLYEAASEFEWARKLMPGHPDPRVNLALTLEKAGRVDEALSTYATALEVFPDYLPATQGMARLQLRHNRADSKTDDYLNQIAMRGENEEWRGWAKRQLIKRTIP